ncbi:MAG: FtsX-like permease family protein [Woeseiaceae bacterium]|nr:FtsX-like permease family protein [Woeseiaceae bacterium]
MRTLPVLGRLAWRNLWRNHRRTFIMLSAISIGVWAMIFMIALMRGMVEDMLRDGIAVLPGHVQVHHRDFLDDPSVSNVVPLADSEIAAAMQQAGIERWGSRVRVPAVVSSERESRGVTLLGVDPARERGLTFVDYEAVEGRFIEAIDDRGIVIGRKLAETLETELGKRIVLMSQSPDNEIVDRGFRIVGLFEAEMESLEESWVFAGKQTAQRLLRIDDRVTEVFALGDDYRNTDVIYEKVSSAIDADAAVQRWTEIDTYLGTMMGVMDGFVLVWVIVVFLALSFGLVNTLVMAVFERVREIGLMLALGMQPRSILGQIIIESMLLLAIGLAIGNVLAWAAVKPLESGIDISIVSDGMEMMGVSGMLYPKLVPGDVILANVVVLILGFVASLSPAWRASRYEPVEAITKVG